MTRTHGRNEDAHVIVTRPVQFTCENCGKIVPFMDAGLNHYEHRNQCPRCLYSKHILFGTPTQRPCGALMHPESVTPIAPTYIERCDGCGYQWVSYDEDWWATLTPEQQTATINFAYERTEEQNAQPVVIWPPDPQYQTKPPPIPPEQLPTRKRVERRP